MRPGDVLDVPTADFVSYSRRKARGFARKGNAGDAVIVFAILTTSTVWLSGVRGYFLPPGHRAVVLSVHLPTRFKSHYWVRAVEQRLLLTWPPLGIAGLAGGALGALVLAWAGWAIEALAWAGAVAGVTTAVLLWVINRRGPPPPDGPHSEGAPRGPHSGPADPSAKRVGVLLGRMAAAHGLLARLRERIGALDHHWLTRLESVRWRTWSRAFGVALVVVPLVLTGPLAPTATASTLASSTDSSGAAWSALVWTAVPMAALVEAGALVRRWYRGRRVAAPDAEQSNLEHPDRGKLRKHQNLRWYFGGQAVSLGGTFMQINAQEWIVLSHHGSTALGVVTALQSVPALLAIWFGSLAQRGSPRRIVWWSTGRRPTRRPPVPGRTTTGAPQRSTTQRGRSASCLA